MGFPDIDGLNYDTNIFTAPCLVMLDPLKSNLGDRLYTTLTRAMDSLYNQRRFCVEVRYKEVIEILLVFSETIRILSQLAKKKK